MAEEALDPAAYIFEGLWTNWTKGSTLGLTWTLCPSKATLLTNSLALFVTLAGGQLWTIIRFSLHQLRAARRPRHYSERFLQQQVILRNASTDLHTMRLMAQVGWMSREAIGKQFVFPMSIVLLAIVHYTVFVVAGTLSNNLINTGSEGTFSTKRINVSSLALSKSPHCGTWRPELLDFTQGFIISDSLESVETSLEFMTQTDRSVQLSLEYAQDCYLANPTYYMSSKCETFTVPKIDFDIRPYTGACPFGPQLCHNDEKVFVFDTREIDSHQHLGLNSAKKDRLTYKRRTTCAVLNDTAHVEETGKSTSLATAYAYYGPSYLQGTNWTYSWSNFSSLYTEFTPQVTIPYQVNSQIAYGSSPKTDFSLFEPLPELKPDKSDLILFFLSYSGRYFEPIDDPWFSAHQLHAVEASAPFARNQYERDRPISTLGCLEQHQFCTGEGICTPYLGWSQVQAVESFNNALTERQNTIFVRMIQAAVRSGLLQVTATLARTSSPLQAIHKAALKNTVLSSRLPDDQWLNELKYWHAIAMAQFQRTISQWGTGQIATNPKTQLLPPVTTGDIWFCNNIMIPSTVYQSFSVVWLVVIIVVGTVVILISWTIEDLPDWFHLRTGRSSALRKIWDSYHMLRLTGFMMRNSWGPLPPPKDYIVHMHQTQTQAQQLPPTIRVVTPVHPHDYSFQWPRPHSNADLNNYDCEWRGDVNSRLWSELPRQPTRDSWVELSLNGFDFGLERSSQSSEIFDKPRTSVQAPLPPAPHLEIQNLREHALARSKRQRG